MVRPMKTSVLIPLLQLGLAAPAEVGTMKIAYLHTNSDLTALEAAIPIVRPRTARDEPKRGHDKIMPIADGERCRD